MMNTREARQMDQDMSARIAALSNLSQDELRARFSAQPLTTTADELINRFSFPHVALCHGCGRRSTADDPELCAVCAITKQAAAQLTHDQLIILLENLTYLAYPPEPLILAPYEKKR